MSRYANYRVCLITGASRGIGRETAIKIADSQTIIIINYKSNEEEAIRTQKIVNEKGAMSLIYQCDVTKKSDVEQMIQYIIGEYGKIDVLINNAGGLVTNYQLLTKEEDWNYLMETNVFGPFYCSKYVLPSMKQNGRGKIVNVSSVVTQKSVVGSVAYATSKAALNGLTKAMAKEVMEYNITVNAVVSGFVETDMSKQYRQYSRLILDASGNEIIGHPRSVAAGIAFFLQDECDFVTGQLLVVDGGFSLL